MIALGLVALIVFAVAIIATRTTITVVIRKDPDMATIKERLATLEADNATLKAALASHSDAITGTASESDLTALSDRVTTIEGEIGVGAAPVPAATLDADGSLTAA